MVRPEVQAAVEKILAGFRRECFRVLDEADTVQAHIPEPPEGWREYFTRRIYTALLLFKEEVEVIVEAHLTGRGKA